MDRELYLYYKKMYVPWYPEAWKEVSALLISRTNYWRGEMLRVKHNLARYMRGEDPKLSPRHVLGWLDDRSIIAGVDAELRNIESALAATLEDNQAAEIAQLNDDYYKFCINTLANTREFIQKHTYGG